MQSLDVFVMPSLTEGTPNTIVEAMAHDKPIIASRVGGIPDMIDDESGVLVPPGDTASLADAMIRLGKDDELRSRMGKAATARYERLFSPKVVLPAILEAYRRVSGGNGTRHHATQQSDAAHPWTAEIS